jgi:hypothetical protein
MSRSKKKNPIGPICHPQSKPKAQKACVYVCLSTLEKSPSLPNVKTLAAMKKIEKHKDLIEAKNAKDLFQKLGI